MRIVPCGVLLALLVACTSAPPPPEPSPLRRRAQSAVEAGSKRFSGRHFEASASSFGQAAEIFGVLDDEVSEAAALRNQAESLRRTGDVAGATDGFERALALDRKNANALARARDLAGLARCASARGEMDRAVEQSEQALVLANGDDAVQAPFEIDLAVYLLERGNAADRPRLEALLESAASPSNEPSSRAAAHLNRGRAQRRFGASESAESSLRQALDEFRQLDDPEGVARTHEELGRLLQARGDMEAARRHLQQAQRGYAFLGDEAASASVEALLGTGRE